MKLNTETAEKLRYSITVKYRVKNIVQMTEREEQLVNIVGKVSNSSGFYFPLNARDMSWSFKDKKLADSVFRRLRKVKWVKVRFSEGICH